MYGKIIKILFIEKQYTKVFLDLRNEQLVIHWLNFLKSIKSVYKVVSVLVARI